MSLKEENSNKKQESGQSLIEFIFLLLVMVGMSFALLSGFNGGIANRWQAMVKVIAGPTEEKIELR